MWGHIPPVSSYPLHNSNDSRTSTAHFQLIPFLNSPLAWCPCDGVCAASELQSEHSCVHDTSRRKKSNKTQGPSIAYINHFFLFSDSSLHVTTPSSSACQGAQVSHASTCFQSLMRTLPWASVSCNISASSLRFIRQ